ncbi:MAG: GNAT family protein [Pyrinomonadaceae bacterium]
MSEKDQDAKLAIISIRPIREDDVQAIFAAVRESLAELSPWMPWCHPHYSIAETIEYVTSRREAWAKEREYAFAIIDEATGRFLGGVGLNQINPMYRIANLGYWVRTSASGRGVATIAARQAAQFGLEAVGLQRIEIVAATGNVASQRVAAKVGAQREGVLRKRLSASGQPVDAVMFSLVSEDLLSVSDGRASDTAATPAEQYSERWKYGCNPLRSWL